jgi:hypothetical protein
LLQGIALLAKSQGLLQRLRRNNTRPLEIHKMHMILNTLKRDTKTSNKSAERHTSSLGLHRVDDRSEDVFSHRDGYFCNGISKCCFDTIVFWLLRH